MADLIGEGLDWAWNDGLDMASNFFAGFGDTLTMGLTERYRNAIGASTFVDKESGLYTAGQVVGTAQTIALGFANPCNAGALASIGIKAVNAIQAVGNAWNMGENLANEKYGAAAWDAIGLAGNISQIARACFVAGTPILTPDGWKPIQEIEAGDLVLSVSVASGTSCPQW